MTWHHLEEKVLLKSDLSQGPDEDSYITQGVTIFSAPASERRRRGSCRPQNSQTRTEQSTKFRKLISCWEVHNKRYIHL